MDHSISQLLSSNFKRNMSLEPDRNPSPPPEFLQNCDDLLPDRVGDSMFSKRWLIQILMNIIEAVNKEAASNSESTAESSNVVTSEVLELDSKLEDDVCSLWDMSANKDVAHFLHEFKVEDIFLEVIDKTKSPRLLEIVVGILGNMASFEDLNQSLSENETLVKAVIPLSGSSDSPTVVQVLRFIHSGVVNEKVGDIWLYYLCEDDSFMKNVQFILENSLNGEVLKSALQLLYYILDREDDICIKWAESEYVHSVIASGKQLMALKEFEAMDELWLLLNLMFQHDKNILAFGNCFGELHPIYISYLMRFADNENDCLLPPVQRIAALAASFTTLATLLKDFEMRTNLIKQDEMFLKYIKNMFSSVNDVLEKGVVIRDTDSDDDNKDKPIENKTFDKEQQDESKILDTQPVSPCNGEASASSYNKMSRSISFHEDDYNNIFILKETIFELCSIILPTILPAKEDIG